MTASTEVTCAVCGEAAKELASAICGECDRPFHLNQHNDVEGKDCGDVWVDEQFLSLRFACFTCLPQEGAPAGEGEPPVGKQH
ncbi:MAG: hypothetical protein IH822_08270 [Chloroflexi bacterium]|nr:hypothetical protein [Chloroflexota bacterium]